MTDSNVISVSGASFSYGGPQAVFDDVSLSIERGDFACVVGPNGGGKTTLLKLIIGLLEPARGSVSLFGSSPKNVRHRVGYMPQQARLDLQFPVTVRDVVLTGRIGHAGRIGPYGRADKQAAARALERVGMDALRSRHLGGLSGGQRQRVLLARALACQPELLLLDEPTSNLDLGFQSELYDLLHELNRVMTVVVVSHDVAFVSKFVKTIVCVNREIDVHAAGEIAGDILGEMYGRDMRLITHDHSHS